MGGRKPREGALRSVIRKIEDDLAYRFPQSNRPMSVIMLSRAEAEQLLKEIYELRQKAEDK
jgi:hypothetical protein